MAALLNSYIDCPIPLSSVTIAIAGSDPKAGFDHTSGTLQPSTWDFTQTYNRRALTSLSSPLPSNWLGFADQLLTGPGVTDTFTYDGTTSSDAVTFILDQLSPGDFLLLCQRSTPGIPIVLGRSASSHLAQAWYWDGGFVAPEGYYNWDGRPSFRFVANRRGKDWPTAAGSDPSIKFFLSMATHCDELGGDPRDVMGANPGTYSGRIDLKGFSYGTSDNYAPPQTYNCVLNSLTFHTELSLDFFPSLTPAYPHITTDITMG